MNATATPAVGPDTAPADAGAAESRRQILDVAARLFRREGYAATTLRAIATECGMKAGSLYYHFASKDELMLEVLEIGVQRVFDAVRDAVSSLPPGTGLAATLGCAIEAHLRGLLLAHDFTSANIRIFGQVPPHVRDAHKQLRQRYERYWRDLLADLQKRGEIGADRNLRHTVNFLFGAMNWATEWHDERKAHVASVASDLADMVARGLAPATHTPSHDH